MKRLLSILGSLAMCSSISGVIVSCSTNNSVKTVNGSSNETIVKDDKNIQLKDSINELIKEKELLLRDIELNNESIINLKATRQTIFNENDILKNEISKAKNDKTNSINIKSSLLIENSKVEKQLSELKEFLPVAAKDIVSSKELIKTREYQLIKVKELRDDSELAKKQADKFNDAKDKLEKAINQGKYIQNKIKTTEQRLAKFRASLLEEKDQDIRNTLMDDIKGNEMILKFLKEDYQSNELDYKIYTHEYEEIKYMEDIVPFINKLNVAEQAFEADIENNSKSIKELNKRIEDSYLLIDKNEILYRKNKEEINKHIDMISNLEKMIKINEDKTIVNNTKIEEINNQINDLEIKNDNNKKEINNIELKITEFKNQLS